jgi:hypothetical protein
MMLSLSAARLGSVNSTILRIGRNGRRFSVAAGRREALLGKSSNSSLSYVRAALASDSVNRWKSTLATYGDSDDDEDGSSARSHGHAEAAKARSVSFSHEEAWMVNLGRDDNNEWLLGTRDADEWFTGMKPTICPGADTKGNIRSLPLPKLDAVTREAAKDYFDNSWTLYETLFAGLNGEEYFYRYGKM